MEHDIDLLKSQVGKLALASPSFSIASELGELIVTHLELNKLHKELDQIKQKLEEEDN